ncbi:MAG: CHC2 zinc finger domain-containing protein, partial [Planctomycetota bacterium]
MHDFEQVKRQILDRISIQDVVAEHVTLKRRGVRWVGLCPFHSEKTPSF